MMTMGRPRATTADWFRHNVAHDDTLALMQHKWGNDGYAFWFKLREALGRADGQVVDIKDPARWELFKAEMRVEDSLAREMLELLVVMGVLDKDLYECDGVLWCQAFVDALGGLYDKRTADIPRKPPVKSTFHAGKSGTDGVSDAAKGQSREEYRTEEDKEEEEAPAASSPSTYPEALQILLEMPGYPFDASTDSNYMQKLVGEFPEIDALEVLRSWRVYIVEDKHPFKKNANHRGQLRNQFVTARTYGKHKSTGGNGNGSGSGHPEAYEDYPIGLLSKPREKAR